MDARLLVSSKFMVSETFGLGEVPKEPVVTIADVKLEEQEGDKGKESWGLLYFREHWAKPLKVNRTHQRALTLMFGYETNDWKGKRVGLRAVAGVFFGKRQTAVRIWGSPELAAPTSFQVRKFGGGSDTYDLVPIGPPKKATPYERAWKMWRDSGRTDEAEFKALIKSSTNKTTPKQLDDADVAKFEAALQGPPPPDDVSLPPEPGAEG
jgi:hypothetical protein